MGGSGGGGGGAPTKPKSISCEELKFETHLSSPVVEVLKLIEEGDELEISLSENLTACVVIFKGRVAGSILGAHLSQLITCIKAGNRFIAIIKEVNGAKCIIIVLHESAL